MDHSGDLDDAFDGVTMRARTLRFAVGSTFTTTDPYDANDTLSQAMAKSFYEGLY